MKHYYLLLGFVLLVLVLLLKYCNEIKQYQKQISGLNNQLVGKESILRITHRKDSSRLFEMDQKLMDERQARILAENEANRFKRIAAVIKTIVEVRRDTIWLNYTDTITFHTSDTNTIHVPAPIAFNDKWFYFGGAVKRRGVLIDSLGFYPGNVNIIIGEKRQGIFKKPLPVVEFQVENPYIHISSANNVIVSDKRKKPILLSRTAMALYGFVLGTVLIR